MGYTFFALVICHSLKQYFVVTSMNFTTNLLLLDHHCGNNLFKKGKQKKSRYNLTVITPVELSDLSQGADREGPGPFNFLDQ